MNKHRSLERSKSRPRLPPPASVDNKPTIRRYCGKPDETAEVVLGVQPVRELLASAPSRIRTLYVRIGTERRFQEQIRAVRAHGGEVVAIEDSELARLAGPAARHQGILAELHEYSYLGLDKLLESQPDPLLLLDGVTDPRNLGAVLRVAECAGVKAIVLAKDRTASLTPAAIKASAGAWIHLGIARCGNVARALEYLKAKGYWIAAMDPGGPTSIYELDVNRRLTLVLGSEGDGIRDIVRTSADFVVGIPLHGRVSSLNVSVAAALALFEIVRRRAQLLSA
jgi:23S rRNA (guanosine2251-2'-O)-methyltransferase